MLPLPPVLGSFVKNIYLPALPAGATGHKERVFIEAARQKCIEHFLDLAAGIGNDLDTGTHKDGLDRPGNRSTDQHLRAEIDYFFRSRHDAGLLDEDLFAFLLGVRVAFHDQKLPGHVQYRRDTPIVNWNHDFHDS